VCRILAGYKNAVFSVHDTFLSPKMFHLSVRARSIRGNFLFLLRQLGHLLLVFSLPQLASNGYYMSVINLLNIETKGCVHTIQNFIFHSEHFNMVIELGMGKSSKKKPMTKKEREERKKRRKENRPK